MDPNEVVGHIPFLRSGVLYPWSALDPGSVQLCVAVMPDCQHLLGKDLITALPPEQGTVMTLFAPRSFRYLYLITEIQLCQDHHTEPCPGSVPAGQGGDSIPSVALPAETWRRAGRT